MDREEERHHRIRGIEDTVPGPFQWAKILKASVRGPEAVVQHCPRQLFVWRANGDARMLSVTLCQEGGQRAVGWRNARFTTLICRRAFCLCSPSGRRGGCKRRPGPVEESRCTLALVEARELESAARAFYLDSCVLCGSCCVWCFAM